MPSIASHFVCASLVSKNIGINSDDFYIGNILPDILSKTDSHYKNKHQHYLIPDISLFLKENNLNDDILLGYLCHLLLDKHFLEEFVPNIEDFDKINLFVADKIYKEYTIMNPLLLRMFSLDLAYLNRILKIDNYNLDNEKYKRNIESINSLESEEDLKYIDFDAFTDFLQKISETITQELKELTAESLSHKSMVK